MPKVAQKPRHEYTVRLKRPHSKQALLVDSQKPRIIVKAGRRGGKTTGMAIRAVKAFLAGRRVLYAAPTSEQIERFWTEVRMALSEPIQAGIFEKNETLHVIQRPLTEARIRAKTAWNADTLRGDYADDLFLDEYQLMDEDAWEYVGAPMLLDNNGNAVFIYTPPSLRSRSVSKARDPRHASKMFLKAQADTLGRWEAIHFTSADNPYISQDALAEIAHDMTRLAYRQEILAEDVEEVEGALWTRAMIHHVDKAPELTRVGVGVDPAGSTGAYSSETGIMVGGRKGDDYYILADRSGHLSPQGWADRAVLALDEFDGDWIVAERNFGGDMVEATIHTQRPNAPVKMVTASRGKVVRAEPIVALYEQGKVHHVGEFPELEEQQCTWVPGDRSPDRLDAFVWLMTELRGGAVPRLRWV